MSLASSLALLAASIAVKLKPPAASLDIETTRRIAALERELALAKRETEAACDQRDGLLNEVARWQAVASNWRARYDVVVDELVGARGAAMRILAASPPPAVPVPGGGGGGGGGGRIHVIQTPPHDDGFWQTILAPVAAARTAEQEAELTREMTERRDAMLRDAVAMRALPTFESLRDAPTFDGFCNCVPSRAQVWTSGDR
jgi:hypothetical protein